MATASENNASTTRPQREAKKRAAAAICQMQGNAKKKRVVLGDLTNVSDAAVAVAVSDTQQRKKIKLQKPVPTVATPEKVEERSDPQLCGPYVSDIYEYLCGMEVLLGFYCFPFSGG